MLAVPGAVHVSTADYLVLEDGGRFDATNVGDTVLTMANPTAFGFLSNTPAPIDIGSAVLVIEEGNEFSLVGGDVSLTGANVLAPGSRVNLASVAGSGEVRLDPDGIGIDGIASFGDLTLDNTWFRTNADSAGDIHIRSGQFVVENRSVVQAWTLGSDPLSSGGDIVVDAADIQLLESQISVSTLGVADAGDLIIRTSGDILILGAAQNFANTAGLFANSLETATGSGGNISISARNLSMVEGAVIGALTFDSGTAGNIDIDLTEALYMRGTPTRFDALIVAGAFPQTTPSGDSGTVDIDASSVTMELGSLIQAVTFAGVGGSLTMNTDTLAMSGGSQISFGARGSGDAGSININANDASISGFQFVPASNAFIVTGLFAGTSGTGSAGNIALDVSHLTLANFAAISNFVFFGGNGAGGEISVAADTIEIYFGGNINAGSQGIGDGGDVTVSATESIFIDGQFLQFPNFTGIFANTFSNGDAGRITVNTPDLEILNGGFVSAGSFSFNPLATGRGGDITVNVDDLHIDGGFIQATTQTAGTAGLVTVNANGSIILENSTGHVFSAGNAPIGGFLAQAGSFFSSPTATGDAGGIVINADELILRDGGAISSGTLSAGDGGDIEINVNSLLAHGELGDFTRIASDTHLGGGHAGSISIDANDVTVSGRAAVTAVTFGPGDAGSITVTADNVAIIDGGTLTSLSVGSGAAGTIDINASDSFVASDGDQNQFGNVSTNSLSSGDGGQLNIVADNIVLEDNAVISATAFSDGAGGDLVLEGRIVSISDGSLVSASSSGAGNAGTIFVIAVDSLTVTNASIETSSELSAGGNIQLTVGDLLFLNDGATVSAAAGGVTANDDGGNITIDPVFVVLRDSEILATANAGNGGNISIKAGSFIVDPNSVIDASSQTGLDGQITIDSVNNVFGSVLLLETPSIDVSDLVTERCVAAAFRDRSSLTVESLEAEIWSPADYAPSPYLSSGDSVATAALQNRSSVDCSISLTLRKRPDAT